MITRRYFIVMLGAIIGDIVGSRFEFLDHSGKDFELFTDVCRITNDTLMTVAVAQALFCKGDYGNLGWSQRGVWWMSLTSIQTSVGGAMFYKF